MTEPDQQQAIALSRLEFDTYALSLPRGHGFGDDVPTGAWRTADNNTCAILRRNVLSGRYGTLTMRRRADGIWIVTQQQKDFRTEADAWSEIKGQLVNDLPVEFVPSGTKIRPKLYQLGKSAPSEVFKLLSSRTHHPAEWLLSQLYLALPDPDPNWVTDCQTQNFHTRLWEALLNASFREQGLLVTQPYRSPDFRIENRRGKTAWVEAVTANASTPYNHVNAPISTPPAKLEDKFFGSAALRFAKTIRSKRQRNYHDMPHVQGQPFAIAITDFHDAGSMCWSRESLTGYLYGRGARAQSGDGCDVLEAIRSEFLTVPSNLRPGLFNDEQASDLSAVIFTNACTIAKLNRVGVSASDAPKGLRYTRYGMFFDRSPGATKGVPFCLDITSDEYRRLWPQSFEPWSAEIEVFHNPHARHPLPHALLPEVTHWFERDGELVCESFYETSVLWSKTIIQAASTPELTLTDLLRTPSKDGIPS